MSSKSPVSLILFLFVCWFLVNTLHMLAHGCEFCKQRMYLSFGWYIAASLWYYACNPEEKNHSLLKARATFTTFNRNI